MNNDSQPLISVVMPVYNCEKYLHAAVESILGQTLTDFELIALDDGSTDQSGLILESYRQSDSRVILHRQSENKGIVTALNNGLMMARGKYIARMDADDISLPDRFEKQVAFLEKHPEVDVLGTAVQLIDERGRKLGRLSFPLNDLAIHWTSLFSACFIHPTVMLRRSILMAHNIHYRTIREQPEDYDFFAQLLEFAHGANFADPLFIYRIHSASVTSQFHHDKVNHKSMLILANLQKHFPSLAISHDQVLQISDALLGAPSVFWKRAEAADDYLRVWQAFSEGCIPDQTFYHLQNNTVLISAKLALYPPFQPGWMKTLRHISKIEPGWLVLFARRFPEMVSTKIHARLIWKNRR